MTPGQFWKTLMDNISLFIWHLYRSFYGPIIQTILDNPILLISFGILILYIVINIFKRLYV